MIAIANAARLIVSADYTSIKLGLLIVITTALRDPNLRAHTLFLAVSPLQNSQNHSVSFTKRHATHQLSNATVNVKRVALSESSFRRKREAYCCVYVCCTHRERLKTKPTFGFRIFYSPLRVVHSGHAGCSLSCTASLSRSRARSLTFDTTVRPKKPSMASP